MMCIRGKAPQHTAKRMQPFLKAEQIEVMKWPTQSPHQESLEGKWRQSYGKPDAVTELWKELDDK